MTFTDLKSLTNMAEGLVKCFGSRECSDMKRGLGSQFCELLAEGLWASSWPTMSWQKFQRRLQLRTTSIPHQPRP